jgi:Copper amine oxidase, enzyme domain
MPSIRSEDITVTLEPFGPSEKEVSGIRAAVSKSKMLGALLKGTKFRVLEVVFPDDPKKQAKPTKLGQAPLFMATIYDYSNHRAIEVEGTLKSPAKWQVTETARQPALTYEEFRDAVKLLEQHDEIGPKLRSGEFIATEAMPPVIAQPMDDGRSRRFAGVLLLADGGRRTAEIVGVDPSSGEVLRFPEGAPQNARPGNRSTCGAPTGAGQATASKGTPGQVSVTIKQGGKTIWTFIAIRPAASSGTNGSGIELRFVNYRGKRMLYRAHVPILNVKYNQDKCGPYRDWQYQEGQIQANGTNVGNTGFRLCSSPAKTILDTGSDTGNFLGTGIYISGPEVVFVSEMQAGWYRYVSEWRFDVRGTLRPRFGFAAVENSCVCNIHHHHIYWRLDFDIVTAGGNRVEEFNDPPLVGGNSWHTKAFEIRRARDPSRKRRWKVSNTRAGASVEIHPGANDGIANAMPDAPFGRGDVWVLKYRSSEIDDGVAATGPPYEAGLDAWINGEQVDGKDVVIWYAGHFTHDLSHEDPAQHGHILGPDIKAAKWPS